MDFLDRSEDLQDVFSEQPAPIEAQFILVQVGDRRLAFAPESVGEIMLLERSQVLPLPFYPAVVMGIVHHQGQLVPLVNLRRLFQETNISSKEVFNAVQFKSPEGWVGLVVDRLIGSCSQSQLEHDDSIEAFPTETLTPELWQPQRWVAAGT